MPDLLSVPQICERLGISRRTFFYLRKSGKFPAHTHKISRQMRWLASDVDAWVEAQRVKR